jgi:hypothetical protein
VEQENFLQRKQENLVGGRAGQAEAARFGINDVGRVVGAQFGHHAAPLPQLVGQQAQVHIAKIEVQAAPAGALGNAAQRIVVEAARHSFLM